MFEQYNPRLRQKLIKSLEFAKGKNERIVKCPICGHQIDRVCGRDHCVAHALCKSCGFNEYIDYALFRKVSHIKGEVYNEKEDYWTAATG
ncbi:MAG: hypothetical protein IKW88_01040 [Clostridiales bacterium]|nr:hypothetical protein [Clostridiales bacterium]